MEDMWRSRRKPVPLNYEELASAPSSASGSGNDQNGIRDQRVLTVKDSFDLFTDRCACLNYI